MILFPLIVCLLISEINSNAINQTAVAHPDASTTKLATSTSTLEMKDDKVVSALTQFAAPKELAGPKKDAIATLETLFSEGGTETVHKSKSVVPRKGVEFRKEDEVSSPPSNELMPAVVANATTELKHENQILKTVTSTNVPNVTLTTIPSVANKTAPLNATNASTTTTTTSTTTTTTSTTTTTTTTARPKKPQIVLSPVDDPSLLVNPDFKAPPILTMPNQLSVEEPAPPVAQATKQYISQPTSEPSGGHREYIVPVILMIFAIPMLLGTIVVSYRRFKDWWLTRHYRRMDFLVDGMYND
jgi:hypothetical protein